jgi:hemerythrin superfamily protein
MLAQPSQKLADDHLRLDSLLGDVKSALANENLPLALTQVDLFWAQLAVHIRAEHLCLFPAVINAVKNFDPDAPDVPTRLEINKSIARLRADHDFFMKELSTVVQELRVVSDEQRGVSKPIVQSIHETLTAVERRLMDHNAREETEVYRWISKLLPPETTTELERAVTAQLESLPSRFIGKK